MDQCCEKYSTAMMIMMAMNWANTLIRISLLDQVRGRVAAPPQGIEPQAEDQEDKPADGDRRQGFCPMSWAGVLCQARCAGAHGARPMASICRVV